MSDASSLASHALTVEERTSAAPDLAKLIEIHRRTTLIHRTDEMFRALLMQGKVAIVYYPVRGQEVLSASMMTALEPSDYLVTTYRGIHDHLAKGVPSRLLWAEFTGKATGTCKGKGGPMHITHPESGVMVTTGIVGSGLPIANGLALGSLHDADGRVTVCCFGDGATNIGAFHEALNMASLWKLPVIFLCQNNGYAEHTRFDLGTTAPVVSRSISYGMRGISVDGNDPVAMYAVARIAVDRARAGEGPTLIDARTFRFLGHTFADNNHYMPADELAAAKARDPVPVLRKTLLDAGVAETELAAIDAAVAAEIADAMQFAFDSGYPDLDEIRRDVLAQEITAT